ncbi:MAG: tyrosine--tRNA ligase [Verrucomicrobiales bacterium]
MKDVTESLEILKRGAAKIISEKELADKLSRGKPLRIKLGVDPTAPDIHLGHTLPFVKLRQFQELGHDIVLIIGDFTATIGDPTGRSQTRPPLTRDEVMENAKTYTEQAFKILDQDRTEIVYNGDWFRKMTYDEILKLNARVTMQQMLQREDFKTRIDRGEEVRLHEIQYPIMQGWDSVEVRADVEIGGTDQLFNILVGRDMLKSQGMEPQVVMLVPLLEGTDGVKKMSKSYGNYIGVTDTPGDMFGKAMSISDELMGRWYPLIIGTPCPEIHPLEAKKQLAATIVERYHSAEQAQAELQNWDLRKTNAAEAELPDFSPGAEKRIISLVGNALSECFSQKESNANIRRMIEQGGIQLDGEKLTDPAAELKLPDGGVLRIGKKRMVRVKR